MEYPNFNEESCLYCIKPEPKYRPFKSTEECWDEMQKHQPFGWMKTKSFPSEYHINNISKYIDFSNYFNVYTFADGSPFGIKEE